MQSPAKTERLPRSCDRDETHWIGFIFECAVVNQRPTTDKRLSERRAVGMMTLSSSAMGSWSISLRRVKSLMPRRNIVEDHRSLVVLIVAGDSRRGLLA